MYPSHDPDPNSQSPARVLKVSTKLAVLFADIAGSTKLYDTLGDTQAKKMVDECIVLMRGIVGQYGGRVVKTIGDEVCAYCRTLTVAASPRRICNSKLRRCRRYPMYSVRFAWASMPGR